MTAQLVGVDGCRAGWIAVSRLSGKAAVVGVFSSFNDLVARLAAGAIVAVDMPIGLPEMTGIGGRGPERLVRPLVGPRRSSVFSVPSRAAVYARTYEEACGIAEATSNPPRRVSKQAIHLFPRIREIDLLLESAPNARICESHPEVVFWRLNGERPLEHAKKTGGRIHPAGMLQRKALLSSGFDPVFLDRPPPRGAKPDDLLDACACLLTAERVAAGQAQSFPDPPGVDAKGREIAIWI